MEHADVTVAIATMDRPHELARCLDSLLTGSQLPAEIIIVDQGSDDSAGAVIAARSACGVPLRHIRQARSGLSASRNSAIAHASAPIIAVTDDDCVPDSQWVHTIWQKMSSGDYAAVTGSIHPLGPDVPQRYAVSSRTRATPADFHTVVSPWLVGSGANFTVRREWLSQIGGYDTRLGSGSPGSGGEDIDMIFRLLDAGGHIHYAPDIILYHERQELSRRLASRRGYGRGIGACVGLWARRGRYTAGRILLAWVWLRLILLATAVRHGRWEGVHEELLVLRGTMGGLWYGLRASRDQPVVLARRAD